MTISLNQNQIDIISAAVLIKDYHSAYLAVANALEENKNHLEYDEQQAIFC